MRALLLVFSLALSAFALPAHAQSTTATLATCITGQLLCNKACGKGPSAAQCINLCGMNAQSCVANNGRWPGGGAADDEDEEESPQTATSGSSLRKVRGDGCTADAEFVHSWPVDKANDQFKFKFRVSSDDCSESSCSGHVNFRIHFNWRSGGNSAKTTLVSYRIPKGQRSTEVTHETFPSGAGMALDVRDVEMREVSCSQ